MFYLEMLSGCYYMYLLDFSTDIQKIPSTVLNMSNFSKR